MEEQYDEQSEQPIQEDLYIDFGLTDFNFDMGIL